MWDLPFQKRETPPLLTRLRDTPDARTHVCEPNLQTYTNEALAKMLTRMVHARILPTLARWSLNSTKLIVFEKPSLLRHISGLRPIEVPELIRKLAGNRILKYLKQRMCDFFAPLQVGIAHCELDVLRSKLQ